MIGQKDLIKKIDTYTLTTLPHSILLVGDRGSEQEEVCEYISKKFNLTLFDISDKITLEYINDIYSMPDFGLYIIDCSKISEREQNILLKFYEEPSQYMYIVLMCESKYSILETIQTRSYELIMDSYTRDQLEPLCKEDIKELELEVANTPGMIKELNHIDLNSLYTLCENIVNKLTIASYQNTLTIADKLNYKEEYDKFPVWAFIRVLGVVLLKSKSNLYWVINDFNIKYPQMVYKKSFVENFLTRLWLASRGA